MNSLTNWLQLGAKNKRKRENDSDDETIEQSQRSTKKANPDPPSTKKQPSRSKKSSSPTPRTRILDRVEIPVYKAPAAAKTSTKLFIQRSPSPDQIKYDDERTPVPGSRSASPAESASDALASGRSHRRTVRRSYKELDPLSDESDFGRARSKVSKGAKKKGRVASVASSDFQDTGSTIDDDDGITDATDGSSITSATDVSSEDESLSAKKSSKKSSKQLSKKPAQRKGRESSDGSGEVKKQVPSHKRVVNLVKRTETLATDLPPMHEIKDIFSDITQRALDRGLDKALKTLNGRPLRVATMCSGTESPLLALDLVRDSLKTLHPSLCLEVEHIFSAEIVPYKQAYIERNFAPPIVFRDIAEFIPAVQQPQPRATTAYGAVVDIPGDPDVVIAGTSCVDFSSLNNNKKGLDDGGESGLTWHGAMAYCKTFRPPIIIFENVQGADWDTMLGQYEELGYEVKGVYLDTKAFYIPHTRQRGYMVCFDTSNEKVQGGIAQAWMELIEKLKRPASSHASAFLIPNDQVVVRQSTKDDDAVRDVDWAVCEITQMQYRQTDHLGNARPWTHWQESGTQLPPERGNGLWYRSQVERVLDTLDCCVLRKAIVPVSKSEKSDAKKNRQVDKGSMYDVRYKTRIWDLSQNVYRNKDNNPFGIAGCITPSGQFFISDAGRAMAPEETLIFQGLPLHKISFTTETPREVQDLAGNAMTTTVVGSALLASLIVGKDLLKLDGERSRANAGKSQSNPIQMIGGTEQIARIRAPSIAFDVPSLLQQASQAARKCYCETTLGLCDKDLQVCLDCGHTCCVRCAGNPEHRYAPLPVQQRLTPAQFESVLREQLPLVLEFTAPVVSGELRPKSSGIKNEKVLTAYFDAVQKAASATYRFSHIRRTRYWTIVYSTASLDGHLELVIEEGRAEWRLFATPAANLPIQHELRSSLSEPVGKSPIYKCWSGDSWQWRVLKQEVVDLKIKGEGNKVPTWWARMELPDFTEHKQWENLRITTAKSCPDLEVDINGLYKYLPHCGTACEGLYKRIEPASAESLYMLLDPTRTDHPDSDQYVFSRTMETLEYHESRPIIASISAPWRPWPAVPTYDLPKDVAKLPPSLNAKVIVRSHWTPAKRSVVLATPELHIVMRNPDPHNLPANAFRCANTALLLSCEVPTKSLNLHGDEVNKAKDIQFLQNNAWMLEAMRRYLPSGQWHDISGLANGNESICNPCAPSPPSLRWRLGEKNSLVPYEDPASAAIYERSIKSRPEPLVMLLDNKGSTTAVNFGANIASLAHRAMSRLPDRFNLGPVSLEWKLATSASAATFIMKPFKLKSTSGLQPCDPDQDMKVKLFPKQGLALAWMKEQEGGVKFALEESEEVALPAVAWRTEVRAQTSIEVRGGICADHPGFGKTITSLALAHGDFREPSSAAAVVKELRERQESTGCEGLLPTAATLIICPKTLVKQWETEAKDKLGYVPRTNGKGQVVVIGDVKQLANYSISDFQQARLVIVNRNLFNNDQYTERLAAFAGVPGPSTNNGRSYFKWLQYATNEIPEHIRVLLGSGGLSKLKKLIQDKYKERLGSTEFEAFVPSKRLRGKELIAANEKKGEKTKTKSSSKSASKASLAATVDTSKIDKPLFEMFYFNRLIVDEFHQYSPKEYAAIIALRADKRWGLSATPAMDDFYDIAQTASLLDIPLRYGSDSRMVMKTKNVRNFRKDMTAFERFDAHRVTPSAIIHERIWELDQLFLDSFVRRNIMDHADLPYSDALVPVALDLDHRVHYTELSQHLNSLDMRIKKGKKRNATERDDRLSESVKTVQSAEEALALKASILRRDKDGFHGMASLIDKSKKECDGLKREIIASLQKAAADEKQAFAGWVDSRLKDRNLGDEEIIEYAKNQMRVHDIEVENLETGEGASEKEANKAEKANTKMLTTELNGVANRLVVSQRSLRFYENVERLREIVGRNRSLTKSCDSPNCKDKVTSTSDLAVSAYCGHVVCKDCFGNNHTKQCVSKACWSRMDNTQLLWVSKMGDLKQQKVAPYGQKLETVTKLMKEIRDNNDQAILFVQFDEEVETVQDALKAAKIKAITLVQKKQTKGDSPEYSAKSIQDFHDDRSNTVMVLNSKDETAAGLNLQHANHVIFFSPLLRDSQYEYDSTMAQAVGRVKRYGQKKTIYIYRVVALNTIDVDILEHRERRTNALGELHGPDIDPPQAAADEMDVDPEPQRTQLVKDGDFFSLRPREWLLAQGQNADGNNPEIIKKRDRVHGWEDFSSLVKWSKAYTEDDDD